jgi:hypothetical protein
MDRFCNPALDPASARPEDFDGWAEFSADDDATAEFSCVQSRGAAVLSGWRMAHLRFRDVFATRPRQGKWIVRGRAPGWLARQGSHWANCGATRARAIAAVATIDQCSTRLADSVIHTDPKQRRRLR